MRYKRPGWNWCGIVASSLFAIVRACAAMPTVCKAFTTRSMSGWAEPSVVPTKSPRSTIVHCRFLGGKVTLHPDPSKTLATSSAKSALSGSNIREATSNSPGCLERRFLRRALWSSVSRRGSMRLLRASSTIPPSTMIATVDTSPIASEAVEIQFAQCKEAEICAATAAASPIAREATEIQFAQERIVSAALTDLVSCVTRPPDDLLISPPTIVNQKWLLPQ